MNIIITFHLFNFSLYDEFYQYIHNVFNIFENTTIIINLPNNLNHNFKKFIINKINKDFINPIILFNINKGVDIYSFIKILEYIKENNLKPDFILKLHTKTHTEQWRKTLIKPLVDYNNLLLFKEKLFKEKNIGFIGSAKYIIQNDNYKFLSNKKGFLFLEKVYKKDLSYKYFIGGTMFWINYKCLENFLDDFKIMNNYIIKKFINGKPFSQNSNRICFEYIYERLYSGILTKNFINYCINDNNDLIIINEDFFNSIKT